MIRFSQEERAVIDICRKGNRMETAAEMMRAAGLAEDPEMAALMESAVRKLYGISDAEYENIPASDIG